MLAAERVIEVGKTYQHYSGKLYTVIAIGYDSDTTQKVVIYQGLYEDPVFGVNPIWVRNYAEFAEDVVINGSTQPRFTEVAFTN